MAHDIPISHRIEALFRTLKKPDRRLLRMKQLFDNCPTYIEVRNKPKVKPEIEPKPEPRETADEHERLASDADPVNNKRKLVVTDNAKPKRTIFPQKVFIRDTLDDPSTVSFTFDDDTQADDHDHDPTENLDLPVPPPKSDPEALSRPWQSSRRLIKSPDSKSLSELMQENMAEEYDNSNGVLRYLCKLCDYHTFSEKSFKSHIRRHFNRFEHICQVNDCQKGFNKKWALIKHMREQHKIEISEESEKINKHHCLLPSPQKNVDFEPPVPATQQAINRVLMYQSERFGT